MPIDRCSSYSSGAAVDGRWAKGEDDAAASESPAAVNVRGKLRLRRGRATPTAAAAPTRAATSNHCKRSSRFAVATQSRNQPDGPTREPEAAVNQ